MQWAQAKLTDGLWKNILTTVNGVSTIHLLTRIVEVTF